MRNKDCPVKTTGYIGGCNNQCGYYDEHARQCSQVSQAMALRDISEQLKRNADAMLDYSPAKEPVNVELQPVKIPHAYYDHSCCFCKYNENHHEDYPCNTCDIDRSHWKPKDDTK